MTESIPAKNHWYSPTADVIRTGFKQFKGFIKGQKSGREKGRSNSQPNERPVSAAPSLKQTTPEHTSTPRSDPTQLDAPAPASLSDDVPFPEPTHCLPPVLPLPVQAPLSKSPGAVLGSTDTVLEPDLTNNTVVHNSKPLVTEAHSIKKAIVCTSFKRMVNAEPSDGDIIMVLMGATGVGKTTFINSFDTENYSLAQVGHHDLDAGTKDLGFFKIILGGEDGQKAQNLILVDTPGFDDPTRSDADVLTCIASYLQTTYKQKKYLAGLIYLHRITDIRFDSGGANSMNIFRKLYGNDRYDRLALVTTMWNDVPPGQMPRYEAKEEELKNSTAWGTFLNRANPAMVARFDASNEATKAGAMDVVTSIIRNSLSINDDLKLRLQRELVDQGLKLPRTAAGRAAFSLVETAKFYLKEVTSS
ncbi:hypothetical protein BJ165DRAFT_1479308 [Panaeolus papilionaceus]|nr:hypothetical protein BJ165DRAFT_1479308 [Panaeolus papilionaceus]